MAPLQRFEKLSEEKQSRILAVAAQEFAQNGFHGASLNRIIAAAGVSKGAMYYYFEDKADLFVTVCRRFDERSVQGLDLDPAHLDAETFWPTLSALTRRMTEAIVEYPAYVGIGKAFHEMPHEQWFEGRIGEYVNERLGQLRAWVARGQAVGAVRGDVPADVLVHLWMAANTVLDRWALGVWDDADDAQRARLGATQLTMMKRMFLPDLLEDTL